MKKIKKIFFKGKETSKKTIDWLDISSKEQKKIVKEAVSGSNKLQRDLYRKAKLI
ncbi:MAG: hypothetical protein PHX25_03465 [Candidatus Pacebacteria bacterium]|nr:hypothetical protein [Candidatus Paceibacterota bacterium]